jgi:hypothetical protein
MTRSKGLQLVSRSDSVWPPSWNYSIHVRTIIIQTKKIFVQTWMESSLDIWETNRTAGGLCTASCGGNGLENLERERLCGPGQHRRIGSPERPRNQTEVWTFVVLQSRTTSTAFSGREQRRLIKADPSQPKNLSFTLLMSHWLQCCPPLWYYFAWTLTLILWTLRSNWQVNKQYCMLPSFLNFPECLGFA